MGTKTVSPPDLPRTLGWLMMCWTVVALVAVAGFAFDMWPGFSARFGPQVETRAGAGGAPELVIRRDRSGRYVVPGTINGVEVEFLVDTGASGVAIPHALAMQLGLESGIPMQIETASDVIEGYLVTLDQVSIGPLTLRHVRGGVSQQAIHDEALLGMSFLRHFDIVQDGATLTLRVRHGR